MAEKLRHSFPTLLQKRIEALLLDGSLSIGAILRADALSSMLDADQSATEQVLASAYRKGLVEQREDGKYSVLEPAKPSIESVFQHTARMGFKPTTIVRDVQVITSDEKIAFHLKVNPGDPIYLQVRSRLVEGVMLANQRNYLPVEVCPDLESQDLSKRSFQEVLEQVYHAVVADVKETVSLAPASLEDRQVLDLSKKEDVVIIQRLSLSRTRQPLVWADIHVRLDRIDYVAALWPAAARLVKENNKEV